MSPEYIHIYHKGSNWFEPHTYDIVQRWSSATHGVTLMSRSRSTKFYNKPSDWHFLVTYMFRLRIKKIISMQHRIRDTDDAQSGRNKLAGSRKLDTLVFSFFCDCPYCSQWSVLFWIYSYEDNNLFGWFKHILLSKYYITLYIVAHKK